MLLLFIGVGGSYNVCDGQSLFLVLELKDAGDNVKADIEVDNIPVNCAY